MKDTILTVQDLSKDFTMHILDKKTLHGCDKVSFTMKTGEFMGIVGPSGSGKSTIIKCLYRTYLPSGGSIWYSAKDGSEIDLAAAGEREILKLRRSEISYVSQFLKVIPRVSATQILVEELRRRGWQAGEAQERSYELLRLMNIDKALWDAYPSTFSGGEQQRINLARALIAEPRLLLLDEPTASLDSDTKKVVIRSLLALKQKGTTIIGIFHDLESMHSMVDKVFTMKAGQCRSIKRMREVV
ncbi:MAG: phnL [Firmicutes bacterium]|nr:phnL [Bacillota bacterium]